MEFAAFLRTKGWRPVNGPVSDSSDGAAFVIKSAHRYPDDVCYPHHDFRCLYAPAPRTGELVILFPGRHVPARELEDLKARAKELFHYRAEPTVIERALRALVPEDRMADRETDGYVFTYYSPP